MSTTPAPARLPTFDTSVSMRLLWERARPNLNPCEVKWFADGAANEVAKDSRLLAIVLEGVAGLIAEDTQAGCLQSRGDVEDLLLFAAASARGIHGLAEIAYAATM